MRLIEVTDGATVADHQVLKAPLVAQYLLQQTVRATARIIVQTLVGTHHLTDITLRHQILEGRHIGLPEVAHRHIRQIGRVASVLWTTMYGIVLGTCPQLTVLVLTGCANQRIALQTTYHGIAHHTGQVRVFTVGLLSSAPSWVTEDVDVGCPYRQTAHLHILTTQIIEAVVILCTELGGGDVEALIQQGGIKRRGHSYWFWEYSDITHIGSTMQCLTPPEELLNTQTGNGRTLIQHQHRLLL